MQSNRPLFIDQQPREMSGWIRLAPAARLAGVCPETLAAWSLAGDIPVSMRQHGPRLRFIHAGQLQSWLGLSHGRFTAEDISKANREFPPAKPEENLF